MFLLTYHVTYHMMPPMERDIDISKLISDLRQRLGISQEKLAAQLRVSLPTINRWEKGKTRPDAMALHVIEQYIQRLGPSYNDLRELYFGDEVATLPGIDIPVPPPRKRTKRGKGAGEADVSRPKVPISPSLDTKSMEGLLWKAACSIRGEKDAPKFKDYILPLVFIKRLSDVFEDEVVRLTEIYGDEETARTVLDADHGLVRFYIPPEATWPVVSGRQMFEWPEGKRPKTLGEQLTTTVRAITRLNASLQGVIDIVDYNEIRNGEREISDQALSRLIELLSNPRYRMGLHDVEPDFLGRAYEYLLRKFAEGQGQSAGEFFTPKEVGWLIAYLMRPKQGEDVYDPCCGSGGLLIKCELALKGQEEEIARPLRLYGQELTGSSFAIARMNMVLHDMEGEIVRGNSMANPKFLDGSSLRRFDIVVTNPMWNQGNFDPTSYENDPFERFVECGGFAPASSADWAWLQHVHASLNDAAARPWSLTRAPPAGAVEAKAKTGKNHPPLVCGPGCDRGRHPPAGQSFLQHHSSRDHPPPQPTESQRPTGSHYSTQRQRRIRERPPEKLHSRCVGQEDRRGVPCRQGR